MNKTIIIGGYGPGISNAVAEKFGKEGFSVALVGRTQSRLDEGVKQLASKGIKAAAFVADLGDAEAVRKVVAGAREKLGPITVLQWNAYSTQAGDLLKADTKAIHNVLDVAVGGLLAGVQAALPDLEKSERGAVLVTNGGFGVSDPQVDAMAVQFQSMGLAMANAAKHKLVGMLATALKPKNVYVGEVMVMGTVKGTSWDQGQATLDASTIGNKFWELYDKRAETFAIVK